MGGAAINSGLVFDSVWFTRGARAILNGVFLRLKEGCICALFGLNGSGKTTLLSIGAGQLRPSGGNVFIDGKPCMETVRARRFDSIAYVSQESFLPRDATVNEILRAFPAARQAAADDEILRRIQSQRVRSLSGGELRYLEVRLVLSLDRKYILLDEPFTGVEPIIIEMMSELILQEARRGKGILLTDQCYNYVIDLADDTYLIASGQCKLLSKAQNIHMQLHSGGYL